MHTHIHTPKCNKVYINNKEIIDISEKTEYPFRRKLTFKCVNPYITN